MPVCGARLGFSRPRRVKVRWGTSGMAAQFADLALLTELSWSGHLVGTSQACAGPRGSELALGVAAAACRGMSRTSPAEFHNGTLFLRLGMQMGMVQLLRLLSGRTIPAGGLRADAPVARAGTWRGFCTWAPWGRETSGSPTRATLAAMVIRPKACLSGDWLPRYRILSCSCTRAECSESRGASRRGIRA